MQRCGAELVEQLRREGERQLRLWRDYNLQLPSPKATVAVICASVFALSLMLATPFFVYPVSITMLYMIIRILLLREWRSHTRFELNCWRWLLTEYFRVNLTERGMLLALLEAEPGSAMHGALDLDGSQRWLPQAIRLPVQQQQSFGRRLRRFIQRYPACCDALSLQPFPTGFDIYYSETNQVSLKPMWTALLKLTIAAVLGRGEAGTSSALQ